MACVCVCVSEAMRQSITVNWQKLSQHGNAAHVNFTSKCETCLRCGVHFHKQVSLKTTVLCRVGQKLNSALSCSHVKLTYNSHMTPCRPLECLIKGMSMRACVSEQCDYSGITKLLQPFWYTFCPELSLHFRSILYSWQSYFYTSSWSFVLPTAHSTIKQWRRQGGSRGPHFRLGPPLAPHLSSI